MEEQVVNTVDTGTVEQTTEPVKTFTQEEVDKMVQVESDRRTNDALERAKKKWESEYQQKLANERSEAEKLARMSESERQKLELEKLQQGFDDERAKFDAERKAFEMERLTHEVTKELAGKNIPVEFANLLVNTDAETTKANMDTFVEKWNTALQKAVEQHVNERLQGTIPTKSSGEGKIMSKKEFANLPYEQRKTMMRDNPELVQQILQQ